MKSAYLRQVNLGRRGELAQSTSALRAPPPKEDKKPVPKFHPPPPRLPCLPQAGEGGQKSKTFRYVSKIIN